MRLQLTSLFAWAAMAAPALAATAPDPAPTIASSHWTAFFMIMVITLGMYFLPTIIAVTKKHPQMAWVIVINMFAGWTVVGWIAAFIWSLAGSQRPQTIIVHNTAQAYGHMPPQPAPVPPVADDSSKV